MNNGVISCPPCIQRNTERCILTKSKDLPDRNIHLNLTETRVLGPIQEEVKDWHSYILKYHWGGPQSWWNPELLYVLQELCNA